MKTKKEKDDLRNAVIETALFNFGPQFGTSEIPSFYPNDVWRTISPDPSFPADREEKLMGVFEQFTGGEIKEMISEVLRMFDTGGILVRIGRKYRMTESGMDYKMEWTKDGNPGRI